MQTRLVPRGLVLLIVAIVVSLLPAQAGGAAAVPPSPYLPSPRLLYPVNNVVLTSPNPPIFRWTAIPDTVAYTLQVATDPLYANVIASTSTSSTLYIPTSQFANGTYYWRLRVQGKNNQFSLYVPGQFSVNWSGTPRLVAPGNGRKLVWGTDNFVFSWTTQPFAATYNLQISTQQSFATTVYSATTSTTAVAVPGVTLDRGVEYYWRVQGVDVAGQVGYWSAPRHFVKVWNPRVPIYYPETLSAKKHADTVRDPVLRWARIDGAVKYEVQVTTDFLLLSGSPSDQPPPAAIVDDETTPLPYLVPQLGALPSGSYLWHVRGIDAHGSPGPWSAWAPSVAGPFRFTVTPPLPVRPLTPVNGTTMNITKPVLTWTSTTNAAYYEVQLDTENGNFAQSSFQAGNAETFLTYTNIFAPRVWNDPLSYLFKRVYWRVRPVTGSGIVGRWSTDATRYPWSFVLSADTPKVLTPTNNQQMNVPVLRWTNIGTARYQVTVVDGVTGTPYVYTTGNTSLTPTDAAVLNDCATRACNWYVQGILTDPSETMTEPAPGPSNWGSFQDTAPNSLRQYSQPVPISPLPGGVAAPEMPSLCWQSVPNASSYQVYYASGTDTYYPLGSGTTAATCQTPDVILKDGTYRWFVRSTDQAGNQVDGPISEFSINSGIGTSAAPLYSHGLSGCELLPSDYLAPSVKRPSIYQPLFSWNPMPWPCAKTGYHLYVSTNPYFTSAIATSPSTVDTASITNTIDEVSNYPYTVYLAPTVTLSQGAAVAPVITGGSSTATTNAGTAPSQGLLQTPRYYPFNGTLYLLIRPSNGPNELPPHTSNVFNGERIALTVPKLSLTSPANGSTLNDTPLFHWSTFEEGVSYEIQIGSTPDLSGAPTIDATTFAGAFAPTRDLPDGTWYWRVRPIVSDIYYDPPYPLEWSTISRFTKHTPAPQLSGPRQNAVVDFTPILTWKPIQRAASYEVQISHNDPAFLNAPLVDATVASAAYVPPQVASPLLRNGTLYWRVRLIDSSGNPGPWSSDGAFRLVFHYPVLLTPGPNAVLTDPYPVFSWKPLPGAASYQLVFSLSPDFANITQTVTTQGTAWTAVAPLAQGTTLYWRVVPVDAQGAAGTPSISRQFTISPPIPAIPTPAPAAPAATLTITGASTITPQGRPATQYAHGVTAVDYQFSWTGANPAVDTFQAVIYRGNGVELGQGLRVKFPAASGTEHRLVYYYDVKTKRQIPFPAGSFTIRLLVDGKTARTLPFTIR